MVIGMMARKMRVKIGFGISMYSVGEKYKGEWKNDKKNGLGKYIWADGSWYYGEWKEGVI